MSIFKFSEAFIWHPLNNNHRHKRNDFQKEKVNYTIHVVYYHINIMNEGANVVQRVWELYTGQKKIYHSQVKFLLVMLGKLFLVIYTICLLIYIYYHY